jgi:hypothetical protein
MGDIARPRIPAIVVLSILLAIVGTIHAAEDFQYREFAWLRGLQWLPAAGLGIVFGLQVFGAYAAGGGKRIGLVVLRLAGLTWCVGAIVVHGREIISHGEYRHGLISKALEVAVIAVSAAVTLAKGPHPGVPQSGPVGPAAP